MQLLKHQTYNDGVIEYGKITAIFDEKTMTKTGDEYKNIGISFFALASMRDEDIVFADSHNYSLDLKIKVPKRKLSKDYIVKYNGDFYNIYKLENSDPINDYIYLQKVGDKNDE